MYYQDPEIPYYKPNYTPQAQYPPFRNYFHSPSPYRQHPSQNYGPSIIKLQPVETEPDDYLQPNYTDRPHYSYDPPTSNPPKSDRMPFYLRPKNGGGQFQEQYRARSQLPTLNRSPYRQRPYEESYTPQELTDTEYIPSMEGTATDEGDMYSTREEYQRMRGNQKNRYPVHQRANTDGDEYDSGYRRYSEPPREYMVKKDYTRNEGRYYPSFEEVDAISDFEKAKMGKKIGAILDEKRKTMEKTWFQKKELEKSKRGFYNPNSESRSPKPTFQRKPSNYKPVPKNYYRNKEMNYEQGRGYEGGYNDNQYDQFQVKDFKVFTKRNWK